MLANRDKFFPGSKVSNEIYIYLGRLAKRVMMVLTLLYFIHLSRNLSLELFFLKSTRYMQPNTNNCLLHISDILLVPTGLCDLPVAQCWSDMVLSVPSSGGQQGQTWYH